MSLDISVKQLAEKIATLRANLQHLEWSIKASDDAAAHLELPAPPDRTHVLVTKLYDQATDLCEKGRTNDALVVQLQEEIKSGKHRQRISELLSQIHSNGKDIRTALVHHLGSQEQVKELKEKGRESQSWGSWAAGVENAIEGCHKANDRVRCESSDCWHDIATISYVSDQAPLAAASQESQLAADAAEPPAPLMTGAAAPEDAMVLQKSEPAPTAVAALLDPSGSPQLTLRGNGHEVSPPSPECVAEKKECVTEKPECSAGSRLSDLPEQCPDDDDEETVCERPSIAVKPEPCYGTLRVDVTSNGEGISGARVRLRGKEQEDAQHTNDDGQIVWANVETGSCEVILNVSEDYSLEDVLVSEHSTGAKQPYAEIEVCEGETAEVEFKLKSVGAKIRGRILERRGGCDHPLSGVKVAVSSEEHSDCETTGQNGSFEYTAEAPGLYEVKVDPSVETEGSCGIPLSPENPTTLLIQTEAGQCYDIGDIRYVALKGQITVGAIADAASCSEQIPLDGLTFVLHADGADGPGTRISGDGEQYVTFSNLDSGRYTLSVTGTPTKTKKHLRLASDPGGSVSVLVTPGKTFDLRKYFRFDAAVSEVHGSVIDEESGCPLPGVLVSLELKGQDRSPLEDRTDRQGRFAFPDVRPGPFRVTLASKTTAIGNQKWVLAPAAKAEIHGQVKVGEKATLAPLKLIRDRHQIVASLRDENGEAIANAALRIEDADGNIVAKVVTGKDGHVTYDVDREGLFYVVPELESGEPRKRYPAEVHSTAYVEMKLGGGGKLGGGRSFGPPPPGDGGGVAQTVEDITSYPILTESVSFPSTPSSSGSPQGGDASSWNRLVAGTVREVLGWRPNAKDSRGVMAALTQSFSPREAAGFTEWVHKPRSYTVQVQADMGAVTGAQASIYSRAKNALDAALPLLDGLTPLIVDADLEDIESSRSIVRNQLDELIRELGTEGGPRPSRVDQLFGILSDPETDKAGKVVIEFDPDIVGGQLGTLRDRFGMLRKNVNTIDEEQNLTNYVILVDYVQTLHQSWESQRDFFDRLPHEGTEPYLGTQLVLVSRALSVVAESVTEVGFAMDSVFLGPAERATITLELGRDELGKQHSPLFVSELLSWIERFASEEAPRLISDSGKDGVVAMKETLTQLGQFALRATTQVNVPAAFKTARVRRAWAELAVQIGQVSKLIDGIKRK